MLSVTVAALIALLILGVVLEAIFRKTGRGKSAQGGDAPYQSGDSASADGITANPAGHYQGHHSASHAGSHQGGHSDAGGGAGHGGGFGGGGGFGH